MRAPSAKQAYLAAIKSDFLVFLQQAFQTLYPNQLFELNWHIEAIVHVLECSLAGRAPRLVINLPPRHLKSFLVSICWPAFLLTREPSLKIFCVSYSDELARTIARDFRRLVESRWYRSLFPQVKLTKATENEAVTDQGGYRAALSVQGSITGRGADLIIVDDPSRPEDMGSDAARNKVNDWFMSTLLSRRDDKQRSGLIIVMQRLHVNDLVGFVEAAGDVRTLSLPAIAPHDEVVELRNGNVYRRQRGEVLQPERESREALEQMRRSMGATNFAAQYQQAPQTPDGEWFRLKWFELVDKPAQFAPEGEFCISIDSALSTSSTADFTALLVAYIYRQRLFVVRVDRGRWDYEMLKLKALDWIRKLHRPGKPVYVVVEVAGSGISLAQYLVEHWDERFQFEAYRPKGSKQERAWRVLSAAERGIQIINSPGENGWVQPFVNELMTFPNGANDDQVDALVQLLMMRWVRCQLAIGQ